MDLADYAVIGSDPLAVIAWAFDARRKGYSVHTEFSGSMRKQYKRAKRNAWRVIDLDSLTPRPADEEAFYADPQTLEVWNATFGF